jgi:hypothetical protein
LPHLLLEVSVLVLHGNSMVSWNGVIGPDLCVRKAAYLPGEALPTGSGCRHPPGKRRVRASVAARVPGRLIGRHEHVEHGTRGGCAVRRCVGASALRERVRQGERAAVRAACSEPAFQAGGVAPGGEAQLGAAPQDVLGTAGPLLPAQVLGLALMEAWRELGTQVGK